MLMDPFRPGGMGPGAMYQPPRHPGNLPRYIIYMYTYISCMPPEKAAIP